MKQIFNNLKSIKQDNCLTILINTHRTRPDNIKDPINLKNRIAEAEKRLMEVNIKRDVQPLLDNLKNIEETIDHSQNTESLAVFVNNDMVEYIRMPIKVKERVVVDNNFATRDIVRAMQQSEHYYILAVSWKKARLLEVYNNILIQEYNDDMFPIINTDLLPNSIHDKTLDRGSDNLIKEFFNRVDKQLQKYMKNNNLPVLLACEERNKAHYLEICDNPNAIIGHINKTRDDDKAHEIIKDAWEDVQKSIQYREEQALNDISKADGQQKLIVLLKDIWKMIHEGRGDTLFVEKGFFVSGKLVDNQLVLSDNNSEEGFIDDIIDELIEEQLRNKGKVVFVENNKLIDYNGIALKIRY